MVKKALCFVVFAALYPDTGEAFISHRRLPAVKQARSNHKLFALAESSRPEWHKKADKPARAWKRLPTLTESSLPPKQQNALVESVGNVALFLGMLGAMFSVLNYAMIQEAFGISAKNWMYASLAYPSVAALSAAFNYFKFNDANGGGKAVAEAMGGYETFYPWLSEHISGDVIKKGLGVDGKPPRIFIIPSAEPNAFAAGTKDRVIAVTTGLIDLLDEDELRAVVAHEVGHLRNQDVSRSLLTGALISGLGFVMSIGSLCMDASRRTTSSSSSSDSDEDSSFLPAVGIILYAAGAVSYLMGTLLRLGGSRTAEFAADDFAKSVGAARPLAAALRKLEGFSATNEVKRDALNAASGAFAHTYIDNPPSRENPLLNFWGLFRTHPSIGERVKRLLADEGL